MHLKKRKNQVFERMGERYGHFIDPYHFMGRNAFEDGWMTKWPATNIKKTKNQYDLEIGLPGYSKEDITIAIADGALSITAQKKGSEKGDTDTDYLLKELETDRVHRTFQLASHIDIDKVKTEFENGLLKIALPSRKERSEKVIKVA